MLNWIKRFFKKKEVKVIKVPLIVEFDWFKFNPKVLINKKEAVSEFYKFMVMTNLSYVKTFNKDGSKFVSSMIRDFIVLFEQAGWDATFFEKIR